MSETEITQPSHEYFMEILKMFEGRVECVEYEVKLADRSIKQTMRVRDGGIELERALPK